MRCSWCHPLPLMPKGKRDADGSILLGGAWVVVINDKGGDCWYSLSLMPTPVWCLSLMTTTIMWSLLTWWWPLQWSQYDAARSMLVDDVHGTLEICWWPWWSLDGMVDGDGGLWSLSVDDGALGDGGALLEMPSWWRCDDCLMMSFGHDGVDTHDVTCDAFLLMRIP